jgi:hypothetical protein
MDNVQNSDNYNNMTLSHKYKSCIHLLLKQFRLLRCLRTFVFYFGNMLIVIIVRFITPPPPPQGAAVYIYILHGLLHGKQFVNRTFATTDD